MKEIVSRDLIIENSPLTVEVPGVGQVKFKMPTKGDRFLARKKARESAPSELYDRLEIFNEETSRLVQIVLIEPTISDEEYNNVKESEWYAIVDIVSKEILERTQKLIKERDSVMQPFLEQLKERNQEISLISSKKVT